MAWLWSKLTLRRQLEGDEARQELLGYPRRLVGAAVRRAARGDRGAAAAACSIDRPAAALRARRRAASSWPPGAPELVSRAATTRARSRRGGEPRALRRGRRDRPERRLPRPARRRPRRGDRRARTSTGCARPSTTRRSACCSSSTAASRRSTGRTSPITTIPFVGLIEHTNFIEPERYGGRRFLYVANYLAPGDPLLALDAGRAARRLRAGPARGPARLRARLDRRAAGCSASPPPSRSSPSATTTRIPPLQTGVPGLVLANTTQIYPEDRGTNYSVRLGGDAARALLSDRP